jgi:hypothetical protein
MTHPMGEVESHVFRLDFDRRLMSPRQHEAFDCHAFKSNRRRNASDASENSQISPSTIVRAARAAGSHPHLASVLLQGRKSANIYARSGVIRESRSKYGGKL